MRNINGGGRQTRSPMADRRHLDEAIVQIRRALVPADCTREALATRLGVSAHTIRGWELRNSPPAPEFADRYEAVVVAWAAAEGMPVPEREAVA